MLGHEEVTFAGRRERFMVGEDKMQCDDCHKLIEPGKDFHRFIISYPYMISGPYCDKCAASIVGNMQEGKSKI